LAMADIKLAQARAMRKAPSATEALLWRLLRDRQLDGLKFRRQVPIGRFIADFLCVQHQLIVEADGPLHDPGRDAERDAWLVSQGYRVLRFRNEQIFGDRHAVFSAIREATREPPKSPYFPDL